VRTLVDTTQAVGWLPVDASRFSYTTGGGYKWLLAPRGTAFLTVRPDLVDELTPVAAGWYEGEDRWSSIDGGPLRLAAGARRFDVSSAWHAWVGQASSLELLTEVGAATLNRHATSLVARFCARAGLPDTGSAIVSAVADDEVPELLARHGIAAAMRPDGSGCRSTCRPARRTSTAPSRCFAGTSPRDAGHVARSSMCTCGAASPRCAAVDRSTWLSKAAAAPRTR
jgi:hypothetical protein